jgi:four helix bundle protein
MDLYRFRLIELSDNVAEVIWSEVSKWETFAKHTLGKQLVRAVDSISANLSEAYGRYSYAERKRFAIIARGSLCETLNWINKAKQRKIIEENIADQIVNNLTDISFKLNYYLKSLSKHKE